MKPRIVRRHYLKVAAMAFTLALSLAGCGNGGDGGDGGFPDGPIRIVVGSSAGGGNDLINRMMAPEMSTALDTPMSVENQDGGSGTVALMNVYSQPSDGQTIAQLSPQVAYVNERLGEIPFPASSFTMLGIVNVDPGLIAVPQNSPFQTLQDLVDAARSEQLTAAISGYTAPDGLGFFLLLEALGIDVTPVVYDGAERDAAIMGGTVDFSVRNGGWYDQQGLRVLAVAHDERIDELPNVPTVMEAAGADVVFSSTRGMAVKSDTPQEVIDELAAAFDTAANSPVVKDNMFDDIGFRWQFMSREQITEEFNDVQVPDADLVLESDQLKEWLD